MSPKPNFFIVGAPKCGTSAMYAYLKDHPEIFMSPFKEPHHFATDFVMPRHAVYRDRDQYLKLFQLGAGKKRIGEASVWYLYSTVAARNIYEFDPTAKIIIMLRNPVEMIYALHGQLLDGAVEDIENFAEALAAEPDRKAGKRIPASNTMMPEALYYSEIVRYTEQVRRYFDTFGRDAVHIIIFDDLKIDIAGVYRNTLQYLGVDAELQTDFQVVNAHRKTHNQQVRNVVQTILRQDWYRLQLLPRVQKMIPARIRRNVNNMITGTYSTVEKRKPLHAALRDQLCMEVQPDIDALSELLDRDLTGWYRG